MADLRKHADDLNNAARLLTEQPHDPTRRVSATVDKAESLQTASPSTGGASESLVTAPTPIFDAGEPRADNSHLATYPASSLLNAQGGAASVE
jgi:hypothetical protein